MRDWIGTLGKEFFGVRTDSDVYRATVRVGKSELGADKCKLAIAANDVLVQQASLPKEIDCQDSRLPIDVSIPGQVFTSQEPYLLEDVADIRSTVNPRAVNIPNAEYRSLLIVPFGDIGVLIAASSTPGRFSQADLARAEQLSAYATSLLDKTNNSDSEFDFKQESEAATILSLLNGVPNGILTLNDDLEFSYMNDGFADMTGYPRNEILGNSLSLIFDDETMKTVSDELYQLLQGSDEALKLEFSLHPKDEDPIPAEAWFAGTTTDGNSRYIVGIINDVTHWKETERTLKNDLDRYEEFASIISHDLQNPLNVAQGRLELARKEVDSEDLESASSALTRIEEIIKESLRLARSGQSIGTVDFVDPVSLAKQSWENIDSIASELIVQRIPDIKAHDERLQHLFENLFSNALGQNEDGLTVRVGPLESGFYVEDNGSGIANEEQDMIFTAGYSTNDHGTGLGLAIVKRIVESHDWEIRVTESEEGGARFEISDVELRD